MEKKTIGTDYFAKFKNLAGFQRRGKKILYTRTIVKENDYATELWCLDGDRSVAEPLLSDVEVELFHWEENGEEAGQAVIFTAASEEEADRKLQAKKIPLTCFYRLDLSTGRIAPLFKVHKRVTDFAQVGENHYILLCSDFLREDEYLRRAEGDLEQFAQIKEEESDYFIAEEVPFWTNVGGYCDGKRGRLFSYEEGNLTQISPDDLYVTVMSAYKNEYVVYCGLKSGGVQTTTGQLFCYRIQEKTVETLDASLEYVYNYLNALSEREILVCRSDRKLHGEYQDEYIDLLDIESGTCLRKNNLGDYHIYDSVVCDVSYTSGYLCKLVRGQRGTYFLATDRESSKVFYWADTEALPVPVTEAVGKVIDYEVVADRLYLIAMRGLGGTELYVRKLAQEGICQGEEIRLSEENTELEKLYQYAQVERIPFINSRGVEIQGWCLKPAGFEEGKKYPTILFIHGGPQAAYGEVFNLDMQLMAARGYGVIWSNPTGSEGRGGDFADIRMQYGTVDYEDLIAFTEHAAANCGWIDRDRLGVTGGSYGGIMTNWIIGHTDLFKAAISDRSSSNNISDFGLSDIGVSFALDTYETTPWGNIEYLWDASPLKYAPNISTPTLWIHGMADYRCTFDSSLQMHAALTYFGVPSRVVGFEGENHSLCRIGKPKHRIRRLEEMVGWFDRYLK